MGVSYLPLNPFFAPQPLHAVLFVGVEPHNKQQALEIIVKVRDPKRTLRYK